jgi:hypothetical protein
MLLGLRKCRWRDIFGWKIGFHADGEREWHEYRAVPWEKIPYIDGTTEGASMPIFRRLDRNGNWQYRRYTDEELDQWWKDQA